MFHPLSNLDKYKVILASGSPRRKELLGLLDHPFSVDTSHPVDETVSPDLAPEKVPAYLSRLKAYAYPLVEDDDRLVITADTVVILDGDVLGKPVDKEDAVAMLHRLAERDQSVVTGVTVRTSRRCETFTATSRVEFAHLSDREIRYYVDTYSPLDKA
ncbi:MAG: Maf family protein, partial [Duncaniella sp.]|nr:Maf family protein [Duncaniella sp.]